MHTLREHKGEPKLLYPAKLSITIDGEMKIYQDKSKFIKYLTTNPAQNQTIGGKPNTMRENTA